MPPSVVVRDLHKRYGAVNAVRGVSFSGGARWFRISTARSGYIRVHEMKSGVATLLEELKARGFRVR